MGLGGIQAWVFSFYPPSGWMDNLRIYGVFFSFICFFNVIPVMSGRREEDNIKLCAMDLNCTCISCIKWEKVASMWVFGGGRRGSGWLADTKVLTSN